MISLLSSPSFAELKEQSKEEGECREVGED